MQVQRETRRKKRAQKKLRPDVGERMFITDFPERRSQVERVGARPMVQCNLGKVEGPTMLFRPQLSSERPCLTSTSATKNAWTFGIVTNSNQHLPLVQAVLPVSRLHLMTAFHSRQHTSR